MKIPPGIQNGLIPTSSSPLRSKLSFIRRYAAIICIVMMGTLLSLLLFYLTIKQENARLEAEFVRRADVQFTLTREALNYYRAGLFAFRLLFAGDAEVSRTEFQQAAKETLPIYPGILALEWVQYVPGSKRAAVEAAASQELGRPFQFTRRGPNGIERDDEHKEYYPILYIEPLAGNEAALGFDLQMGSTKVEAEKGRATDSMMVTVKHALLQRQAGVVMIWPVFVWGPANRNFIGYVEAVCQVDEMFRQLETRRPSFILDSLYLDTSATKPTDRLLHRSSGSPMQSMDGLEEEFNRGLRREYALPCGGLEWKVVYRPQAEWLEGQHSLFPWVSLGSGLLVTALTGGLFFQRDRQSGRIEREVEERTAELKQSRRQLANLVKQLPGLAFQRCYDDDSLTYVSEGALVLTGYPAQVLIEGQVKFRDLWLLSDREACRKKIDEALSAGGSYEIEYRLKHSDGSLRWVLERGRVISGVSGESPFLEGLMIDITPQRAAEAEKLNVERKLLETQKLESLGVLAGGIAPDFNNLLTALLRNAGLARLTLSSTSPVN